jgi:hypothetical protein
VEETVGGSEWKGREARSSRERERERERQRQRQDLFI